MGLQRSFRRWISMRKMCLHSSGAERGWRSRRRRRRRKTHTDGTSDGGKQGKRGSRTGFILAVGQRSGMKGFMGFGSGCRLFKSPFSSEASGGPRAEFDGRGVQTKVRNPFRKKPPGRRTRRISELAPGLGERVQF